MMLRSNQLINGASKHVLARRCYLTGDSYHHVCEGFPFHPVILPSLFRCSAPPALNSVGQLGEECVAYSSINSLIIFLCIVSNYMLARKPVLSRSW